MKKAVLSFTFRCDQFIHVINLISLALCYPSKAPVQPVYGRTASNEYWVWQTASNEYWVMFTKLFMLIIYLGGGGE
jgi:hypothetical protein